MVLELFKKKIMISLQVSRHVFLSLQKDGGGGQMILELDFEMHLQDRHEKINMVNIKELQQNGIYLETRWY